MIGIVWKRHQNKVHTWCGIVCFSVSHFDLMKLDTTWVLLSPFCSFYFSMVYSKWPQQRVWSRGQEELSDHLSWPGLSLLGHSALVSPFPPWLPGNLLTQSWHHKHNWAFLFTIFFDISVASTKNLYAHLGLVHGEKCALCPQRAVLSRSILSWIHSRIFKCWHVFLYFCMSRCCVDWR